MAATIKTTINKLKVKYESDGLSDVVIAVQYDLSGNDRGTVIEFNAWGIEIAAPDPSSFIAFKSLTESDVLNFMKATEGYNSRIQTLTAQIAAARATPTTCLTGVPW